MITQYVEEVPADKSHPDFTRKPIALTIQEGKLAIFKAIVIGDPEPVVSWARSNGDVSDPAKYQMKFDPVSRENTLEMANVSPDQADTYKCYAKNEFGKAVVTVMLNVIEGGAASTGPSDFKSIKVKAKSEGRREGEIDPKFWELLLSADKKDYERICAEYGVTDFRWMLKKLNEMKKEREEEQAQFIKNLTNLKPIEVKGEGYAQFEIDMDLLDASSRIFIYKDGEMVPYSKEVEMEMKHSLKQVGKKYVFTIRDLLPDDAGLYQLDVEDVNIFSTDFKIPMVDFLVKIQEVKAMEREDAVFECVLSNPFSHINWFGKSAALEAGEKYDITVSEDKLIHRLVVKDCMPVDKGIYAAVAGIKSCNAWLVVESDDDPNSRGKKKAPTLVPSAPVFFTLERPPSILVPLKVHTPPKGYQCYMTCAIRGCPAPHVSWYLDGICISGDKHYYITNAHGVCSMYILRVSSSDSGEYKVVAVNSHGKAECSTKLRVKGMDSQSINQSILFMQRF
uniref:Ig-like domain-containing protein n=1 Tax=Denticeps clupeoides TaxID=299321 RepID=A0AAY4BQ66_9TELE